MVSRQRAPGPFTAPRGAEVRVDLVSPEPLQRFVTTRRAALLIYTSGGPVRFESVRGLTYFLVAAAESQGGDEVAMVTAPIVRGTMMEPDGAPASALKPPS
jgi:hypothetical protein